jgi:hypothetical protein
MLLSVALSPALRRIAFLNSRVRQCRKREGGTTVATKKAAPAKKTTTAKKAPAKKK